jgi:hypothetical protein
MFLVEVSMFMFLMFVFLCIAVEDPIITGGVVLTPTPFCACPKPEPVFLMTYVVVVFVYNGWR